MNCPNCQANSSHQRILSEGNRQCTVCATVWSINENGAYIVKPGQTFLAEVDPNNLIM